MPQSITFNNAPSGEVRISGDGTRIYNVGTDGVVRVYDTLTGELVAEWPFGGNPGAVDISPDGSTLIIFDRELPVLYSVDLLRFGQVSSSEYPQSDLEGLIVDVAMLPDLTFVVIQERSGGSLPLLRRINFGTQESQIIQSVFPDSVLSGAVLLEGGVAQVLVTQPTGLIGTYFSFGAYETGGLGSDSPVAQALSANFVAIGGVPEGGVRIFTNELDGLTSIDGSNLGTVRELAFSADGQFLHVLGQNGGTVFSFRTSDWSIAASVETGVQIAEGANVPVTLLVDPRGQFFTIETEAGFTMVENTLAPVIEGTEFPDVLVGTLFSDVISPLGADDQVYAGGGADTILSGEGFNVIDGGSDVDTLVISGNAADYTITQISTGRFEVWDGVDVGTGGSFNDVVNVEFVRFDDQTIRLLPGTGVSVNFNTPNPAVYQSAMNAIRDFDGNALGGDGFWLRIGEADVNGDGDLDQILVNDAIGRFATVGTAPDGLVYFADHGWAGETRVAGIYIDPLVEAGIVEAGSDFDSQRRFQNDLAIENINRVLGADDYNDDGIQEVFFALTDGTAYLRALMHADGNIRYANYQSQQEVIDYLTANGYGEETWGSWFSAPTSAEAAPTMQDMIDGGEASGIGRAGLVRVAELDSAFLHPSVLPGAEEFARHEFYG